MTQTTPITKEPLISNLDDALSLVEQRCQPMRWRLANFAANVAAEDLKDDIEDLAIKAFEVARLYGELGVIAG